MNLNYALSLLLVFSACSVTYLLSYRSKTKQYALLILSVLAGYMGLWELLKRFW